MKKIISVVLVLLIALTMLFGGNSTRSHAASKYIKVNDFVTLLAKEIGLKHKASNIDEFTDYKNQLMDLGILKNNDFTKYTDYLKRGDCLVLLSRTDDYLNHPSLDDETVQLVVSKRIYDINNIAMDKRSDVARGFLKGFYKGSSRGQYATCRNLKLACLITKDGAKNCLKMLILNYTYIKC